jgi:hypothetical protein
MEMFPKVSIQVELAHPHDLIVRYFLIDIELFASLIEYYGGTEVIRLVNLGSLQCESPIIIDDSLKEVIGDLCFSARFKAGGCSKVFLFFEHQSKKENKHWQRSVHKLLEFYESCSTNPEHTMTRDGKYPYAVVIVLYHGKTPWKELIQIENMVSLPSGVDCHILSVPTILIDVSRIPCQELKGHPALVALLDTLQSASEGKLKKSFDRIVGYFDEIKTDPRTFGWINALTRYILAVTNIKNEIVARAISKILGTEEANKMVMSTMEKLFVQGEKKGIRKGIRKGEKQGRIEGKVEGRVEGKIQAVLKVIDKRFKKVPKSISQSVNSYTDLIALDSLFELALDCKTLEEFKRGLAHK